MTGGKCWAWARGRGGRRPPAGEGRVEVLRGGPSGWGPARPGRLLAGGRGVPCERVCSALWRGAPGLSDPVRPRKQRSHVGGQTVARLSEAQGSLGFSFF